MSLLHQYEAICPLMTHACTLDGLIGVNTREPIDDVPLFRESLSFGRMRSLGLTTNTSETIPKYHNMHYAR
jgi:hypothetical protein